MTQLGHWFVTAPTRRYLSISMPNVGTQSDKNEKGLQAQGIAIALQTWMRPPALFLLITASFSLFAPEARAVRHFTHFIDRQFLDPIKSPAETLKEVEGLLPPIEQSFGELVKTEQQLVQEKQNIGSHGLTAEQFLDEVQTLAHTGVDNARLTELISKGQADVGVFTEHLDGYIPDLLDATMALTFHKARADLAQLALEGGVSRSMRENFKRLDKQRQDYVKNWDQYGEPKDTYRASAFRDFFVNTKRLYLPMNQPPLGERITAGFRRILGLVVQLPTYLRMLPDGVRALKTVFRVEQPDSEYNPVMASIGRVVRRLGKAWGYSVKIEGAENLPTTAKPGEIDIFVVSHRSAFLDEFALASLGVENMVYFAAPGNFLPKALNVLFGLRNKIFSSLNENNGFIIIGKGRDQEPVEKALKAVREFFVRAFLIFPGGRVPEGLGATMGVRKKFLSEEGLIAAFEKAGYKVNLIPISLRDNAALFDSSTLTNTRAVAVKIFRAIDDQTRREITRIGGPEALGLLLRYGLIEDLVTNEELIWGQVRASKIETVIERYTKRQACDRALLFK